MKMKILCIVSFLCMASLWSCNKEEAFMDEIEEVKQEDGLLSRGIYVYYFNFLVDACYTDGTDDVKAVKSVVDDCMFASPLLQAFYDISYVKGKSITVLYLYPDVKYLGIYDPEWNVMEFRSIGSLRETFPKVLTHFAQNLVYDGGTSQYTSYGKIDILEVVCTYF